MKDAEIRKALVNAKRFWERELQQAEISIEAFEGGFDLIDDVIAALEANPPLAEVEGWMTQRHLDREDTNAICIWQFPEGQDKEIMFPVTVTIRKSDV